MPNEPSNGGVRKPRPTSSSRPERDHLPRLDNVFAKNPLYFITCCTAGRRRVLTEGQGFEIIRDAFAKSPDVNGWAIGKFVVMPDHIHFFTRPGGQAKPLTAFIRDWKRWTARHIAKCLQTELPLWQPEFFDHVLRSAESYSEKWEYVRQNPVRAGLVTTAEAWPYTDEVEQLSF